MTRAFASSFSTVRRDGPVRRRRSPEWKTQSSQGARRIVMSDVAPVAARVAPVAVRRSESTDPSNSAGSKLRRSGRGACVPSG